MGFPVMSVLLPSLLCWVSVMPAAAALLCLARCADAPCWPGLIFIYFLRGFRADVPHCLNWEMWVGSITSNNFQNKSMQAKYKHAKYKTKFSYSYTIKKRWLKSLKYFTTALQ